MAFEMTRLFHIAVHDVAPVWATEIDEIFGALGPLVGARVAAGLVPCWHGEPLRAGDDALVGGRAEELLLHGWEHRRAGGRGPISLLTVGADEFSGLARAEARRRLERGRDLLETVFARPIDGFLPPAYQFGAVDPALLAEIGFRYRVGWARAADVRGTSVRLATRSWDVSPVAALSALGAGAGRLAEMRRNTVPAIVIHPLDVRRGLLPRAVTTVRSMLDRGRRPALVRELLAAERVA